MCDPVTVGAVVSVASTAFQIQQQRAQGKFQQGTAAFNARTAENEAQATRNVATEKENLRRQKTAELLSRQRAQLGAANVELGSGSALQLQQDTITLGEADALRIRDTGNQQFSALQSEASLTESKGEFAASASKNKAFGSLLSGGAAVLSTGVADKWFTPKSAAKVNNPSNPNPFG